MTVATREQVDRAMEAHGDELASYPNVVGLGVVEEGAELALAVYVSEQSSDEESGAAVPGSVEIASESGTDHVEVVVRDIGEMAPESDGDALFSAE